LGTKYLKSLMAIDRGKQYEYAIMISAYSRIDNPTVAIKTELAKLYTKPIEDVVQSAADGMINSIEPPASSKSARQLFYNSFKQLGGSSPEPKTDVLFVKGGTKYKCSMKWGASYQLSSAGISGTVQTLDKVLRKVAAASNMSVAALGEIALVLEMASNIIGNDPVRQEQSVIKTKLNRIKSSGGLNEQLQQILGSRKNTKVDDAYLSFKREVIREALTGNLIFGSANDKAANYILNESQLKKIDDSLVNDIANKTYIDMRLKGRGKTPEGVRLNEIVVRIEPV